jgi:hypothetical protein
MIYESQWQSPGLPPLFSNMKLIFLSYSFVVFINFVGLIYIYLTLGEMII